MPSPFSECVEWSQPWERFFLAVHSSNFPFSPTFLAQVFLCLFKKIFFLFALNFTFCVPLFVFSKRKHEMYLLPFAVLQQKNLSFLSNVQYFFPCNFLYISHLFTASQNMKGLDSGPRPFHFIFLIASILQKMPMVFLLASCTSWAETTNAALLRRRRALL